MACINSIRARIFSMLGMAVFCGLATCADASAPAGAPAEANPVAVAAAKSANGNFAADLYRQLAEEQPGKNLFFSPSSVSTALTIAANGAVGETALQMGRVLRFPDSVRSKKADGAEHPWNMAMINSGQAALNAQFKPPEVPQAIRDRIAKLREDLTAANGQTKDFQKNRQMDDAQKSAAAAQELAGELNKLLGEVNQYELHTATALWVEKTFPLRPSLDRKSVV